MRTTVPLLAILLACNGSVLTPTGGTPTDCGVEDADSDGVMDGCDACPTDPDNDADQDGICADLDVCPDGDDTVDTDDDGVADACDVCPKDPLDDEDGDTVCGDLDQCPGANDLMDQDADGLPNQCDDCPFDPLNDDDGDGFCGDVDRCPGSDDALNADGDQTPDGCDPCPNDPLDDNDGDGVCGDVDVCPGADDAIDADGDGTPDGCDICPADPLDACGAGLAIDLTPTTGTLTQDGASVWADRGYRFDALTNFSMSGASWNCNPPLGSTLTLSVYDAASYVELAQSPPIVATGGETWHDIPLNFAFTAGTTYTVAFHSSDPATLTYDRMDSGTMGYAIPPWMADLQNCSSFSNTQNAPPEYPDYCTNSWPPFMQLFVVP